jgi:copper(I)-binding protein
MQRTLLTFAAVIAMAAPALAGDYKIGALTIKAPWTRPAMAGMNGVGFMTIANAGAKPVTLLRAESPVAGAVEMHSSSMSANGVMSMRREDKVAFSPGGYHFMLLGLKQPLTSGQKAPVTLIFENGRRAMVELTVQAAPPQAAKGMPPEHQHH